MAKGLDYSLQLEDIRNPSAADGGLLVSAGQRQGAASRLQGESNASLLALAGETAMAAGKGYLEAQVSKDTKEALDNLDTDGYKGPAAAAREAQYEKDKPTIAANIAAAEELDKQRLSIFDTAEIGSNPDEIAARAQVEKFRAEAAQLQKAASAGNLSPTQAIDAIAASVKKYSAMMPGWATDFRKVAANLTGISNVDVLGIHSALTKESQAQKANLKLTQDVAEYFGLPSLQAVTPYWRDLYMVARTTDAQAKQLESQAKIKGASQAQVADRLNQVVAAGKTEGATAFVGVLHGIVTDNTLTGETANNALRERGGLAIDAWETKWMGQIDKWVADGTGLDAERARKMREDIAAQAKTQRDALNNSAVRSAWLKNAELFKTSVEGAQSQWRLNNMAAYLITSNPQMYDVYLKSVQAAQSAGVSLTSPPTEKDYQKLQAYGVPRVMFDALQNVLKSDNTKAVADGLNGAAAAAAANPVDSLAALKETDKEKYATVVAGSLNEVSRVARSGLDTTDPNAAARFADQLQILASQAGPQSGQLAKEWATLISNPNVVNALLSLPKETLDKIAVPVLARTEANLFGQRGMAEKLAVAVDTSRSGRTGESRWKLEQNAQGYVTLVENTKVPAFVGSTSKTEMMAMVNEYNRQASAMLPLKDYVQEFAGKDDKLILDTLYRKLVKPNPAVSERDRDLAARAAQNAPGAVGVTDVPKNSGTVVPDQPPMSPRERHESNISSIKKELTNKKLNDKQKDILKKELADEEARLKALGDKRSDAGNEELLARIAALEARLVAMSAPRARRTTKQPDGSYMTEELV